MKRSELNKNILNTVIFIKELKKIKSLTSFKLISNKYIVIVFVNDSPIRVVLDDSTETIDIYDVNNIYYVQHFNQSEANEVIKELEILDKNTHYNFRVVTLSDFRDLLEFVQKDKIKYYLKLRRLSDDLLRHKYDIMI